MKKLFAFILIFLPSFLFGQWQFPLLPVVDTLEFTITDTIYISPDGNDSNSGTLLSPVKTFDKATELLPFDQVQNFGLIIFLEGTYYPKTNMDQDQNQWQQNFTGVTHYKNVSVLGQGNVEIYGDSIMNDAPLGHAIITLRGQHIFVKDITLRNSPGVGLGFNNTIEISYHSLEEAETERTKHLIVDGVRVIGARSHGIFIQQAERVLVENCSVSETSEEYQLQYPASSAANWGGGIKFIFSSDFTVRNNYVHENYGEGINLSLSYNSYVYDNELHDNRSEHIYCSNTRKSIIRNNLIYTNVFDSTFWSAVPPRAAIGISIRNEFAFELPFLGYFNDSDWSCEYGIIPPEMASSSLRIYYPFGLGCESFPTPKPLEMNSDSLEIFNNVILNAGRAIALHDGTIDNGMLIFGGERSVYKNINIHHNTCYGWSGDESSVSRMLDITEDAIRYFTPMSIAENIQIHDNIFLLDSNDISYINIFRSNSPTEYDFSNNLWNGDPESGNFTTVASVFAEEIITNYIPDSVSTELLNYLNPSCTNELQHISTAIPSYLNFDFNYQSRNSPTNIGALENGLCCPAPTGLNAEVFNSGTGSGISVSLNWNAVQGANRYQVKGKPVGAGGYAKTYPLDTYKTVHNLLPGTEYEWQVRARCYGSPDRISSPSPLDYFSTPSAKERLEDSNSLHLYPNPATNELFVHLENNMAYRLQIVDILGRTMTREQIQKGINRISIEELPAGVYLVFINQGNMQWVEKLIVE